MKKIGISMIIAILFIIGINNYCLAKEHKRIVLGEKVQSVEFTQLSAKTINQPINPDSSMYGIISSISGVVALICYAAAFIVLIVKGVQFMSAAPEGKAEIKKQMIAIVIGAFIVFAITSLLNIIMNVTKTIF